MSKNKADSSVVTFRALQIANEHRSAYGLRYNDFSRYRNHCANRTHRLRSTLRMTHGKGREFKKLPAITLDNINDGHLQLLLFETERAWAYSQELNARATLPANASKASKIRHCATGRFRRAIHWCTQMLSHSQALYSASRFSAENMVEATAYTLILSGKFLRHRDEYEDAIDQLSVARTLLDALVRHAASSRDQALATLFADEISPEIRFCSHQLGRKNSYDVDATVAMIAPKIKATLVPGYGELIDKLSSEGKERGSDGKKQLKPLVWEGKEVPVRNPELVDVLLQVQVAELRLHGNEGAPTSSTVDRKQSKASKSRKGVAAFDDVLAALSDAEGVARKLVESHQASGSTSTARSGTRDIFFLHSYLTYQLLSRRIERDLALIEALVQAPGSGNVKASGKHASNGETKAKEVDARVNPAVVKLLETILQSLEHMRTLSVVDESPDLASAVDARLSHAKGRKCLFLARAYASTKQYAQALVLSRKAMVHLRECASLASSGVDPINDSTPPFYPLTQEDISSLESLRTADEKEFKLDWFQFNGGTVSSERDSTKKPIFYDIALNYVQLDLDRLQERAGLKAPPPKMATSQASIKVPEPVRPAVVSRAKAEEIERPATPEPSAPGRGGLSSLLGGWWGRK